MKHSFVVLFTLLALSFGVSATTVQTRWTPEYKDGTLIKLSLTGSAGGVVTLSCAAPKEALKIGYKRPTQIVEMFVMEVPSKEAGKEPWIALYGLSTLAPRNVTSQFSNADKSFLLTYYPVGAVEQFFKRKADKTVPVPVPQGSEEFISGPEVKRFMTKLMKTCSKDTAVQSI